MEHQIQHFKAKAYYKSWNDQRSINNHQEIFDILENMMEVEREDGRKNMHFIEEELTETRKKSAETVADTRCDARIQISEIEDKVYAKFKKAEVTRRDSLWQAAEILSDEKERVAEVRRLKYKNMADKIADMEEKSAEMIRVTRHKMDDMEEKAADITHDMRRKTLHESGNEKGEGKGIWVSWQG